ncbi:valyl-tRNA synthetase [Catenulispora acidiphila DSM 44928]|uniref:Valine--tRNA ligase n=1 Tax=Catenulispora acidiphila (strain DSM 44928 / JCM 14897 / NBRC 102108 / NRRL B-24433 / ID139908) TaxID=479433 RepID=C7Q8D1_CATAD|nr:valine--tRNA ligase [Catenulispora acidiphila]ACU76119.1 valyl-tRNA synthetase [Catenulispora acidiphila DSM 44928]
MNETTNSAAAQGAAGAATTLPTAFVPVEVEGELYERWVKNGYFTADAASDKEPFTIVIPPPNVTGSLHVGHALNQSIQDAIIRRKRMQGFEALYLPGMDHAGIATQNAVERELAKEGLSRHDLGREAFVRKVWDWKAEYGGKILGQQRRLGISVDWSRERFTMDEGLSKAVQTIFKKLYEDGLIYRAERIINWCPRCLTALSDIEVDHYDEPGELVSIRYGDGEDSIVVATSRAETMLGDTAVAVHPDDERYRHLIGKEVALPLTDRRIPIVADEHVDPEFGTGAVKVTPAHDPNDFEIGRRHNLPMPSILDEHANITVHGPFLGMDRFEARPAVVAALREDGRVVGQKQLLRPVGHCSRCETVVEPRLSMQWWVKVEPLAKAAGDAVRDGRVQIHPKEMEPRYFAWVDNMHDWTISRQLWWGHRIPIWYGPDGEVVCVGPDEEPPAGAGWQQDSDVLDTWFSSGLWPFSTLGWPERTADLAKFYPTSVLHTGYDIIFFWVARMMMFGLYAMDGKQPFDKVVLSGLVRDQFGKKMSKSKGNGVDPLEWMDKFGSDAVRFGLLRGANPGSDQAVAEDWIAGARNFATKIWNATRFAMMNGAYVPAELPSADRLTVEDRWILSRLNEVVAEVDALYEDFQFAKAMEALYHFAWDEVCDWYIELSKLRLPIGVAPDDPDAQTARAVLGHVLDVMLRLLHPAVPYVTETLWTALTGRESVVIAEWPAADLARTDKAAEAVIEAVQEVVTEVRRFRTDQGVKDAQRVVARLTLTDPKLAGQEPAIRLLNRLTAPEDGFSATATLAATGAKVELDTSGTIDVAAERKRLDKGLAAARKEVEQANAKLGNADFLAKAPDAVVDKIRKRLADAESDIARLGAQLDALPSA